MRDYKSILVTGAGDYVVVDRRLRLWRAAGWLVRCLALHLEKLMSVFLASIQPEDDGVQLPQTADLDTVGLWGLGYWYKVWRLHLIIFTGMLRGIAASQEQRE